MKSLARTELARRRVLKTLLALGVSGETALALASQQSETLTRQTLSTATALLDLRFDDERLEIITRALQRNLDQFQVVRDLDIDDTIEPALIFSARGR